MRLGNYILTAMLLTTMFGHMLFASTHYDDFGECVLRADLDNPATWEGHGKAGRLPHTCLPHRTAPTPEVVLESWGYAPAAQVMDVLKYRWLATGDDPVFAPVNCCGPSGGTGGSSDTPTVPLPASLWLLGGALAGIFAIKWRKS